MPAQRRWDPYFKSPLLQRELRLATHRSILGPAARCDLCGETRSQSLIRRGHSLTCYECQAVEQGRSRIEQDHPLGRGERWIRYTRPLAGNRHRLVSHPDVDAHDAWADLVSDGTGQDAVYAGLGIRYGTTDEESPLTADLIEAPGDDTPADGTLVNDRDQRRVAPPGPSGARTASLRGPACPAE